MSKYADLPKSEKSELEKAWVYVYNQGDMDQEELEQRLASLGYNATQIYEVIKDADKYI